MKLNKILLIVTIILLCITTSLVSIMFYAKTTKTYPCGQDDKRSTYSFNETENSSDLITEDSNDEIIKEVPSSQRKTHPKTEVAEITSSVNTVLKNSSTYRVKNTPKGDGLVLRSAPSSSSKKLDIIPEGTKVFVYSDNPDNRTGYVYVLAFIQPMDRHGYILKEYLSFESDSEYTEDPNIRHVSYSTPEHKGLVMRSEATYYSSPVDNIIIREGDEVTIVQPYDPSNNGYVYVNYNQLPTGDNGYYGWVLYKYLTT